MDFAVIGLGRFGSSVATTLVELGHQVLGVDRDGDKVQDLAQTVTHVVQADATDEDVLRSLGLRNFPTVVVAIGQDLEASVLVTMLLKEMGVARVVAKAASVTHGKLLARIGADRVVFPERDMGVKVARSLAEHDILDYIEVTPDVSVAEVVAGEKLWGKNLRQLDLRARFRVTVLALRRGDGVLISPHPDEPIRRGDILVVIGENDNLEKLHRFQEAPGNR